MEWTIPAFAFSAEAGTHLPTQEGWKAELALGGWLATYQNKCLAPGIKPNMVAHLSTNRVRRRLTSLIEANALTTTPDHQRGANDLCNVQTIVQRRHRLGMCWYVQMRVKSQQPQTAGQESSVKLDPATHHSLLAYATLNKFLQSYIDHVSCIPYAAVHISCILKLLNDSQNLHLFEVLLFFGTLVHSGLL